VPTLMQTKGNEKGSGMHKVLIVYGTRSEAIRVAPLIREIERSSQPRLFRRAYGRPDIVFEFC
jgi:hypothetical protein